VLHLSLPLDPTGVRKSPYPLLCPLWKIRGSVPECVKIWDSACLGRRKNAIICGRADETVYAYEFLSWPLSCQKRFLHEKSKTQGYRLSGILCRPIFYWVCLCLVLLYISLLCFFLLSSVFCLSV